MTITISEITDSEQWDGFFDGPAARPPAAIV